MDNQQAINELSTLKTQNATTGEALQTALDILTNGFTSDQAAKDQAVADAVAPLNTQIATLTAEVSVLQTKLNNAQSALN